MTIPLVDRSTRSAAIHAALSSDAAPLARASFVLSPDVVTALRRAVSTAGGAETGAWVALMALLHRRYGGGDVAFVDADDVPLVVSTAGDPDCRELIRRACRAVHLAGAGPVARLVLRPDGVPPGAAGWGVAAPDGVLTLTLTPDGEAVRGVWECTAAPDDPSRAARLAEHFANLATDVARRPDARLSSVGLLGAAERERVLTMLTGAAVGYPEVPVHELFARVAASRPDAVALTYCGSTMTFGQLDARADRLAARLQRLGVGIEDPVGVCIERSPDMVIAVLAVLKAGGAYVPLDPAYPIERIADLIRDARLRLIVTSAGTRSFLQEASALVHVDDDDGGGERPRQPRVQLDHAAYFVYTSGSTGRPKAIVLTHRAILNGLNRVPFARDNPDETSCLNTSLGVAFTTARLFLPLLCGLPLAILPDGVERELTNLVAAWEAARVTNVAMVTSVLRQLLDLGPTVTSRLERVQSVVVGGEAIAPETLDRVAAAMPQALLIYGYASSEIGGAAVLTERPGGRGPATVALDFTFPNTRIHVLDRWFNPLPVGVPGEVCVSAPHLARGYLRRPGLTAARFVPNPFAGDGARLYRTGDIGRLHPGGGLELLGRLDDQVKIRGFRIEVREVEAALAAHPGVAGVAVAARDFDAGRRLVAYVMRRAGTPAGPGDLREFLLRVLPEHMLPSIIVFVDEFPRTPTGKIDRQALPPPDLDRPELDTAYEPPRTPVERQVAQIWMSVLGLPRVGAHDHFLELGGDSMLATNVALQVGEQFGIELNEATIFERPTIADLAAFVAEHAALGA